MYYLGSMFEYIVRGLTLKALFGTNEANIYSLYQYCERNLDSLSKTVIEAMVEERQCSTEKRTEPAILDTCYSRKELEDVVEELKGFIEDKNKENGGGDNTNGNEGSCGSVSETTVSNGRRMQ